MLKQHYLKIWLLVLSGIANAQSAITYNFSGGRLGDNLLAYMHAKWLSYIYELPLIYKPFKYSDELVLHEHELSYTLDLVSSFSGQSIVGLSGHKDINPKAGILYTVPYFTESLDELTRYDWWPCFFPVNWEHAGFKKTLQDSIAPRQKLTLIYPPTGYFSVALHVRKNSEGFDPLLSFEHDKTKPMPEGGWFIDHAKPLKHSPDSMYIDLLKKMMELVKDQRTYVYIFTDDPNPTRLVDTYSKALNNPEIIFDCRKIDNHHYVNVLEDLFSMVNFDALIRSDSNFALIAEKIGNHKIVLSPLVGHFEGDKLVIDQIRIKEAV